MAAPSAAGSIAPLADHHQHIFSSSLVEDLTAGSGGFPSITAGDVLALLDEAGIRHGLVLSGAYMYGSPARTIEDEYAKVQAENDWAGDQAALYPDRLRAFMSINPLKPYALDEIARCAKLPHLHWGIKLHFGNSDVQLDNPSHIAHLRDVFAAANAHSMAIIVHLRASISRNRPYGAAQAQVFVEDILPLVPDVPVQIAHLAGSGPGYDDPPSQRAMAVFADSIAQGDQRSRALWFDVATVVDRAISPDHAALVVQMIRRVGVERVLYGSDAAAGDNLRPREGWAVFRHLPLTEDEFTRIASNLAPYFQK